MEELKPCPFCGGRVYVIENKCLPNGFVSYSIFHNSFERMTCILAGQTIGIGVFDTEEEALRAWNRRATK